MRRSHLTLGLLLLGAAAAVGFYTSQPAPGTTRRAAATAAPGEAGRISTPPASAADIPDRSARALPAPAGDLRIEAADPTDTSLVIRIRRIDEVARTRLEVMTEDLDLTTGQRRRIYPLFARSHPEFDDSLRILGGIHLGPPGPISKDSAEQFIQGLLDPDQLIDREIAAAQDDIWWTHLVAKLEKDLVAATNPAASVAPQPDPDPDPIPDDQPRTAPLPHRGGNLLDHMENQDP